MKNKIGTSLMGKLRVLFGHVILERFKGYAKDAQVELSNRSVDIKSEMGAL